MTFKPSKLSPGFNLTWEGSRMMLPEHVAMLQQRRQRQRKKRKPMLDMQAVEKLEYTMQSLFKQEKEAIITVFGKYGSRVYMGRIASLDPGTRKIKLTKDDEDRWIRFDDIIEIEES